MATYEELNEEIRFLKDRLATCDKVLKEAQEYGNQSRRAVEEALLSACRAIEDRDAAESATATIRSTLDVHLRNEALMLREFWRSVVIASLTGGSSVKVAILNADTAAKAHESTGLAGQVPE